MCGVLAHFLLNLETENAFLSDVEDVDYCSVAGPEEGARDSYQDHHTPRATPHGYS